MTYKKQLLIWPLAVSFFVVFTFTEIAHANTSQLNKSKTNIAAAVNEMTITFEELEREFFQIQQQYAMRGQNIPPEEYNNIKNHILENLINSRLLYQDSQKKGIIIGEERVTTQLNTFKSRFSNEDEFKSMLTKLNVTENDLKNQILRDLSIEELIYTQIARNITVSDSENKIFYDSNPQFFQKPEQIKASHILIKLDPKADMIQKTEAKEKMKKVQEELDSGKDFAAVAKALSEGPSNVKGGDLGYFGPGQMVKPFEEAAFLLQVGEVSPVVETQFGYHIIKVYDKQPATTTSHNDVKNSIDQHLRQEKVTKEVGKYIEILRKDAKIEKY